MKTNKSLGVVAKFAASLSALALLSSCGGGDPYAGLWTGSVSPQRQALAMVLDEGEYYMLYSKPGSRELAGLVHGTGDFHAATFSSKDAVDYNWERQAFPPVAGVPTTLSAKVSPQRTVSGSVNNRSFTLGPDDEFGGDARLAAIVGSHSGEVAFTGGKRLATMHVTANGDVSTNVDYCIITGKVVPRADVNAFDLTMNFSGSPCAFPNAQFKGIAFYREDTKQLYAAVTATLPPPFYRQGIGFQTPAR